MNSHTERMVRGLIAGDSAGALNSDFHIHSLPPKRVHRQRFLTELADRDHVTNVPRPFAHANPPALLHPAPAEASEWFVFSYTLQHRTNAERLEEWRELAASRIDSRAGVRIGVHSALLNLSRGLAPHQAGNDNPHYFDDLAMVRAAAAAAAHDHEAAILEAAKEDAQYTTARDGLWCAVAVALLLSRLARGADGREAARAVAESLPSGTWSRRVAEDALAVAEQTPAPLARARRLSVEVGDWIYSYPTAAPETLAFLLAHVAAASSAEDLMLGTLAQPHNGATLPALAGIAAALRFGEDWIPADVTIATSRLAGLSIPQLAGLTFADALTP
ncbi:ADP-ribosylglycohydrolase family protein [Microbacterium luteolum]|uniref:ADP-ribosylglycohydrolase family protein n=1 Tax=Microbacterium luteolum TaxID=69367 RepID=A0ABY7XQA8_MICLT|nr:ADP-ribosylglycohydrolase family protein [Microbacterium luteolum]WDM44340.1 ADP-ribosylglycohydrolase family protein [Microbacterium luteolum]